jgi:hypothetical protein
MSSCNLPSTEGEAGELKKVIEMASSRPKTRRFLTQQWKRPTHFRASSFAIALEDLGHSRLL